MSSKHVVSPPTSILAYDDCHDTRTLHRTVKFATMQLVERTAQTPACLERAFGGSCHPRRVYAGGTNWWVVRRRANGGVNAPPLLETPAVA